MTQACPSGPDVFPHDCETSWQVWDSGNKTFQEDSAIHVTQADLVSVGVDSRINRHAKSLINRHAKNCTPQHLGLDNSINCLDNEVPPVIEVVSRHIPCVLVGDYVLVAAARPNGLPLWHKEQGDMWLYSGMDNRWYIAGASAKLLQFFCAVGEIYHAEEHLGRLPHQMQGCWECYRQGVWVKEPRMAINAIGSDELPLSI